MFPPQPENQALVYFFRARHFAGGGISYNIKENDKVIGAIANGTYFFEIVDPGEHTFTASTEATVSRTINAEAGKTYYVECSVTMGIFAGRPDMKIVTQEESSAILPNLVYATK